MMDDENKFDAGLTERKQNPEDEPLSEEKKRGLAKKEKEMNDLCAELTRRYEEAKRAKIENRNKKKR